MSLASSFPCLSRMRALLFHIHFLDLTLNKTTFLWLALTCNQIGIVLYKKDWCFCMGGKRHPPSAFKILHFKNLETVLWRSIQFSKNKLHFMTCCCRTLAPAEANPFFKSTSLACCLYFLGFAILFFSLLATGFAPTTSTGHIMQNRDWQNHLHSGSVYTLKHKGYTPKLVLWTDMAFLVCVVETQTVCTGVWLLRHPGP